MGKNNNGRIKEHNRGDRVFLVRNVASEKFGGGEIYQLVLARKLSGAGFSPVIISNSRELIQRAKKEGFLVLVPPYSNCQNWSGYRNVFLPAYKIFQIRLKRWYEKMINYYKPVVINLQSRDDMIAGTLAAKKYGIRVLWTDHADFKNWVLWNVNKKFKNIIGKRIINLSKDAERVIFVSENIAKETRDLIMPKKLHGAMVIENGVEDSLAQFKNVKLRSMSFVFIGRVVKEKGIEELISAFLKIAKDYPKVTLDIFGEGKLDVYRRLSSDCDNIRFMGKTERPLEALAERQIFVLPSYTEGLSLSLLDAAMMKRSIIATNVGGNNEVVKNGKTGLLVSAEDNEDLAEKMKYMLDNNEDAVRMARNARKLYEEKFNIDKIFEEKMLPLYNISKERG